MAVAEVPFDLVEVKLAPPQARPDTVAKAGPDRAAVRVTFAGRDAWWRPPGTARRRWLRGGPKLTRVRSRGSRSTARTTTR